MISSLRRQLLRENENAFQLKPFNNKSKSKMSSSFNRALIGSYVQFLSSFNEDKRVFVFSKLCLMLHYNFDRWLKRKVSNKFPPHW